MNKRFAINMFASVFTFVVNLLINFILSPFIVSRLGVEANGFISLSTNFVNYASVLTAALNSLFGRYLTIELHKKNIKRANEYFTSVFYANILISIVLFFVMLICTVNLHNILSIPAQLYIDVKITFMFTFMNYILGQLFTVFSICTFARNRLDLSSLCNIFQYVVKIILLVLLYTLLPANMYYVPMVGMIVTIMARFIYTRLTKKLLPEIKISRKHFKIGLVITILKNGVWMSLQNLNKILETGLDLLITNNFVSGVSMGYLSIAKIIPNVIYQLSATIANVFSPTYAELYAKEEREKLISHINFSVKVMAIIMATPLAGLIVFGEAFFCLWQKSLTRDEIHIIQILSVLTLLPTLFNCYMEGMYYINVVTNRIKTSVIVTFLFGIVAVAIELILLFTTDLGVYAVAGTSAVVMSIRYIFFTPMYCAHILKMKLSYFYSPILKALCVCFVEGLLFFVISMLINTYSLKGFIMAVLLAGIIGYGFSLLFILNKGERQKLNEIFKRKILKK